MQILYYFHVAIAIFVIVITDIEVGKELNFGKENEFQRQGCIRGACNRV